jgi:YHS domain-containing protein
MHTGKAYFAIQINTWDLQQTIPKSEFTPIRRALQAQLKAALNGRTDYASEQAAAQAFSQLPEALKTKAHIVELTPVFGII